MKFVREDLRARDQRADEKPSQDANAPALPPRFAADRLASTLNSLRGILLLPEIFQSLAEDRTKISLSNTREHVAGSETTSTMDEPSRDHLTVNLENRLNSPTNDDGTKDSFRSARGVYV